MSIGNFDGVHRGHSILLERLRRLADDVEGPALILTFEPHPARLLRPDEAPPPLMWLERKAELLESLGVDAVIAYPTDQDLLSRTAAAFFQEILLNVLDARGIVEGPNFCFGRDREGDIGRLRQLCEQSGRRLDVVAPLEDSTELVSSSRIRRAIEAGEVASAARWLGRPHRIRGRVVRGKGRGVGLGFPTANLEGVDTVIPGVGVYGATAITDDGRAYPAAVNIGPCPTFGESAASVEVHLVDYRGDLYDRSLQVDFLGRLRETFRFSSVEALAEQLVLDVAAARQLHSEAAR